MSLGKKLFFGFGGLLALIIIIASSNSSHTATLDQAAQTPSPAPNMESTARPVPSVVQQTPAATPSTTPTPIKSIAPVPTTTPVAAPIHTYTNVDGNSIESPDSNAAGATGVCNDGTYTHAVHHQGACSSLGGVNHWL